VFDILDVFYRRISKQRDGSTEFLARNKKGHWQLWGFYLTFMRGFVWLTPSAPGPSPPALGPSLPAPAAPATGSGSAQPGAGLAVPAAGSPQSGAGPAASVVGPALQSALDPSAPGPAPP